MTLTATVKNMIPNGIKRNIRRFIKPKSQFQNVDIKEIESEFLENLDIEHTHPKPLFILAAPRTGSTLLYQLIIKNFDVHYFTNYTDTKLPGTPVVGEVLARNLIDFKAVKETPISNSYGRTEGSGGPSEATRVFSNWFTHEHPSAIKSSSFISDAARENMFHVFAALKTFYGETLVTKNAWNCFRIKALAELFPEARFLWLRRDIAASSYSAFQARKKQGDPQFIWNSSSPANYSEIKKLTPHQQVVEQQFWTNQAVEDDLKNIDNKTLEIWYEDLLTDSTVVAHKISEFLGQELTEGASRSFQEDLKFNQKQINDIDFEVISDYVDTKYPHLRYTHNLKQAQS